MQPWRQHLNAGQVIPACPLALNDDGSWSEHHQRALLRYYVEAGAGGLAVGVHSTQFAIRNPQHALYQPLPVVWIRTRSCRPANPANWTESLKPIHRCLMMNSFVKTLIAGWRKRCWFSRADRIAA